MNKIIKAVLLKNDLLLVAEVIEVMADLGEPNCKLVNPYKIVKNTINDEYTLESWPDFTYQNELMVHSDSILTIADPKPSIAEKYFELTA